MNDATLQRWSEILAEVRAQRESAIASQIQEKAASFSPAEFFELAAVSLENALDTWLRLEEESWGGRPPAELESVRGELESVMDFELDAISGDAESVRSQITWESDELTEAEASFQAACDELRKKYQLKLNSATGAGRKKAAPAAPPPPAPARVSAGSSSGGGSPVASVFMFLLGLLLGAAPAVLFWDGANKAEKRFEEERAKLTNDQQTLLANLAMVQDLYEKLATGKMRSLPAIDREIQGKQAEMDRQKSAVQARFTRDRERLLKRVRPGDQQDDALAELDEQRDKRLAQVEADYASAVEGLRKEKETLEQLLIQ